VNLRPRRREEPEVSLTPLIDVVFTILIFFMVSTTFVTEGKLRLVLPQASAQPSAAQQDPLELAIDANGQFFLDGKPLINRQTLTVKRALAGFSQDGGAPPLVIKADANTPHQAVVTALDAAGQAGIKQISIATVPDEDRR
jgi:biopolymer transport protein ExbD